MPADPGIKHIVVLMMENRSFDHLVGFRKRDNSEVRGVVGGDYTNLRSNDTKVLHALKITPRSPVSGAYFLFSNPTGTTS